MVNLTEKRKKCNFSLGGMCLIAGTKGILCSGSGEKQKSCPYWLVENK